MCCVTRFVARLINLISDSINVLRRATTFISDYLKCDVARPVARRFVLNLVWMTYVVVCFVARRLTLFL
jgi:hypothetical protein